MKKKFIYVFCVDMRKKRDYLNVKNWMFGFYEWEGVCLMRGKL